MKYTVVYPDGREEVLLRFAQHPRNPAPDEGVIWGQQSWNEMFIPGRNTPSTSST